MNNTITIDNVPEGFELTGEYRPPALGEYYMTDTVEPIVGRQDYITSSCRPILRKLEPPKPPPGYELTGEYRAPVTGEFYRSCDCDTAYPVTEDDVRFFAADKTRKRWILRKLEPPKPPAGYELTGEYREIVPGDWYVSRDTGRALSCGLHETYRSKRWILRPVWQPPSWLPKGCWLYEGCAGWWVSDSNPYQAGSTWTPTPNHVYIYAKDLAALHGETFTPPRHTNCLQIQ